MKKLLGIVVLGLFFFQIAFAKPNHFQCKSNVDKEFIIEIDLLKKNMNIFGNNYSIFEISDKEIVGKKRGINGDDIFRIVTFDRYTAKLTFIAFGEETYTEMFVCKKPLEKIL
jgi:hypothetical protein